MQTADPDDHAALYDGIVRDLYSAGLTLCGVASTLGPGPAADRLQAATADLDSATKRVRAVLDGLPATAPGRFASRLFDAIAMVTGTSAPTPSVHLAGPVADLPEDVVGDLVTLIGAVLTEAARLAGARDVRIRLTVADGSVSLQLSDDGDALAAIPETGVLGDVRRRAEERGGRLVVAAGPDGGTHLAWVAPFGPSAATGDGRTSPRTV